MTYPIDTMPRSSVNGYANGVNDLANGDVCLREWIAEAERWRRAAEFLAADDGEDDPIPDAEWVNILVARAYKEAGTE